MKSDSNTKLLMIFVGLLVVGIIFLYFIANNNSKEDVKKEEKVTYNIILKGSNKITIEEGETFIDPGYEVMDNSGFVVNGVAKVESNVDYNKPGKYTISYMIDGEVYATREVIVKEKKEEPKPEPIEDEKISFKLVGDEEY